MELSVGEVKNYTSTAVEKEEDNGTSEKLPIGAKKSLTIIGIKQDFEF
uniref:Uncharacterized protein n=1 Tax=Candidozyma auris TaxID=498019 RepID=A0A0L0P8V0_CANAR